MKNEDGDPICWRCKSTSLGTAETHVVSPRGGTEIYEICEDCGAEQRQVGWGGVL